MFGNTAASKPLFGGATTAPAPQGGLFGASTGGAASGGLFGAASTSTSQPQTQTGGMFGATGTAAQPQAGALFGSTPATQPQTGGLFGATAASQPATGGLFGASTAATQPQTGGLFGVSISVLASFLQSTRGSKHVGSKSPFWSPINKKSIIHGISSGFEQYILWPLLTYFSAVNRYHTATATTNWRSFRRCSTSNPSYRGSFWGSRDRTESNAK